MNFYGNTIQYNSIADVLIEKAYRFKRLITKRYQTFLNFFKLKNPKIIYYVCMYLPQATSRPPSIGAQSDFFLSTNRGQETQH